MVGDTMEDAVAAAAAGIGFVYMTHGYGELVQTPSIPIAHKLDGFSQFLQWMTQEPVRD
jgi:phosphoglycolate phosphatase-like HAD superfamily hydrolase